MNCIYCSGDTSVVNSRPQKRTNTVWRRRQCKDCGVVFTSQEAHDLSGSVVVRPKKQKTAAQPFSRDKLFVSIYDCLKHRETALADATALTATVMSQVVSVITTAEIESSLIADACYQSLQLFDKAAATQYAAYHL